MASLFPLAGGTAEVLMAGAKEEDEEEEEEEEEEEDRGNSKVWPADATLVRFCATVLAGMLCAVFNRAAGATRP